MAEDLRGRANTEIARLQTYWREIEFWLKKAEQVNQAAIIPAINELRYASRQLIVATTKLAQTTLSPMDERHVGKRLVIAEQYLFNAEHDIADSITTYYARFTRDLDEEVGPTAVTEIFPEYPLMKSKLQECQILISEARQEYEKRQENYGKMKSDQLPFLIDAYMSLTDAEVKARHRKDQIETELIRAKARIGILEKFAIAGAVAGLIALLAIPLSIYTWVVTKEEHCRKFADTPILNAFCPAKAK